MLFVPLKMAIYKSITIIIIIIIIKTKQKTMKSTNNSTYVNIRNCYDNTNIK